MEKNRCTVSSMFSTARIYALLSIVSAHMFFPGTFTTVILSRAGTAGVIVFLIMSGYFYRPHKFSNLWSLIKTKFVSLCVPWFVLGTSTWIYKLILIPDYRTITQLIKWIIGNGSYLYYMSVLVLCFWIFYKAKNGIKILALLATVLSNMLTASGIMEPILAFLKINNYLNVFNWIGFFSLGMLLQEINEEKIATFFVKYRYMLISLGGVAFLFVLVFNNIPADYFSYIAIPYELVLTLAIFSLSTFTLSEYRVLKKISDSSFTIYLIHLVFIGLLDGILAHFWITRFFSPIIIIALCFGTLEVVGFVAEKINIYKLYVLITGIRK